MKSMRRKIRRELQKHKIPRKSILLGSFLLCAACLLPAGCAADPGPEAPKDDMVIIDHEQEEFSYATTTISVEDVIRTARVACNYRQAEESEIKVSAVGRTVQEIYVEEGDSVVEGQLLAMLSGGDREAEIRELEYKIARNKLLLSYTEMDEEYDRSYQWWYYIYRTSMSEKDTEQHNKELEAIHQRYRYLREDYQDAIDLDTQQLEFLRQEMEQCRIYADKTGEISYLDPYILGNVIKEEKLLLKIFDRAQCVFESPQTQYAQCFQEGQRLELSLFSSGSTISLEVTPVNMEHWQEKMFLESHQETPVRLPWEHWDTFP